MMRIAIILFLSLAPRASAAEADASKPNPRVAEFAKEVEKGNAGDPYKQTMLGSMYLSGEGVPQDPVKGAAILRAPAERGYAWAQSTYGRCFIHGAGVKKDAGEGMRWLEKAAEQGYSDAQRSMALYSHPTPGERPPDRAPEDLEKVYFWSTLTMLSSVSEDPQKWREDMIKRLPAERIAALDERVRVWEPKRGLSWKGQPGIPAYPCFPCVRRAAENGDPAAQVLLGNLIASGVGLPQDPVQGLAWIRRSAEQGHEQGQVSLAAAYFFGRGVKQDYEEAYFWITFPAEAAEKEGRYEDDTFLGMIDQESHQAIGKARAEEIERRAAAWKPTLEKKKAATPKAP